MTILLLVILWSLWFLNFGSRVVLSPLLPIVEDELGLSHALAGGLFSFLAFGYTATSLVAGWVSLRTGYKRAIGIGFFIVIASLLSLKYTVTYFSMAGSALFIGIGTGLYMPCAVPIITAAFERKNWAKAIAVVDSGASLSIFSMPILTVVALRFLYWRNLFVLLAGACLAALALFLVFAPNPRPEKRQGVPVLGLIRRREFWIVLYLWIFATACVVGLYAVLPLFLVKERGITLEFANTLFGISRVGGIATSIVAGYLADRYGIKRVLFFAFVVTGASTVGIALAKALPLLVAMLVAEATFCTGFFPVGYAAISRLTTLEERSTFVGIALATGATFGHGLTPIVLGAVADVLSFQSGILILGFLTVLCSLSVRFLRNL